MRISIFPMLVLVLALTGSACASRTMNEEQAYIQKDYDECKADADSLNDPPRNSENMLWKTYFERCMRQRGYTEKRLRGMWY